MVTSIATTQPSTWQGIISNPLDEGKDLKLQQQSLALLYRLSSLHPPSSLSSTLPAIAGPLKDTEIPRWLTWITHPKGRTERETHALMSACVEDGAWALFQTGATSFTGKGKSRAAVRDESAIDRLSGVDEEAWGLIEWFVSLWEKDEECYHEDHPDTSTYSPMFVCQIPRPFGARLQADNSSLPLMVVRAALREPIQRRRLLVAARVLKLLIHTALPPSPPFHPPSLLLSLLHLFRPLPLSSFQTLISALQPLIPTHVSLHLLAQTIEDLSGVRAGRAEQRRFGTRKDYESTSTFASPTVMYTCELLTLPCSHSSRTSKTTKEERRNDSVRTKDDRKGEDKMRKVESEEEKKDEKMVWVKMRLLAYMLARHPLKQGEWEITQEWEKDVKKSLGNAERTKAGESLLKLVGVVRGSKKDQ
ncbi:hypothetical protein M231_04426 [Tremella mesenterica]|uniref:Uncharacterized protein n=1 Tax=Tremella mesenterica TaxID=5217 RepID=A0A4Q1BKH6_TREME|nr:hypothetical protein M231_04426 [Tremella mesenterica]